MYAWIFVWMYTVYLRFQYISEYISLSPIALIGWQWHHVPLSGWPHYIRPPFGVLGGAFPDCLFYIFTGLKTNGKLFILCKKTTITNLVDFEGGRSPQVFRQLSKYLTLWLARLFLFPSRRKLRNFKHEELKTR